ncbi:hypothetical protein A2U01_0077825, partial [Trifolium medium]|nr:hypothetical protein [Trifolium medium]
APLVGATLLTHTALTTVVPTSTSKGLRSYFHPYYSTSLVYFGSQL